MKKIVLLFLCIAGVNALNAQEEMNKLVFDDRANQEILVGNCDMEGLKSSPATDWFIPEYEAYSVDEETLKSIQAELIPELELYIVMGTWCGDSHRELPRILKITDFLNLQSDQITIVGVDSNKEADNTPVRRMNIELVPTIIVYLQGDEVGRIIESPIESLEKDLLNMIIGN